METILISGGTGLIGEQLSERLRERGYEVIILSRSRNIEHPRSVYFWDIDKGEIDRDAIAKADYIIHLAGVSVGEKRWTKKRKQEIIDSRIKSGQLILNETIKQNKDLKAFISSSAIGYYGSITTDKIFSEEDPPGDDFLGKTCKKWEDTADSFHDSGIRTVKLRTGVVLSGQGGALSKMLIPIKLGFGSALGSGKQYFPWIHIDDLCGIYIRAIEDSQMEGAYNAVAPAHITNSEFTQVLASHLNKKLWFPKVPAFALKLLFGKMSVILLQGSRVSSKKVQDLGFKYLFSNPEGALKNLFLPKKIVK